MKQNIRNPLRRDIQSLRGIAVLSVLLFHAYEPLFPNGFLGVDVFFIISGFVITPLLIDIFLANNTFNKRVKAICFFYKQRFYRLFPAFISILLLASLILFLFAPISDFYKIARQGIASLFLVGNYGAVKFAGDYFSPNMNPLVHMWSLGVEIQIYLLLPFILLIITLKRYNKISFIFYSTFGAITLISFYCFNNPKILYSLYSDMFIDSPSNFSFYSTIERVWQFGLGALGQLIVAKRPDLEEKMGIHAKKLLVFGFISILAFQFSPDLKFNSIVASITTIVIIVFKVLDIVFSPIMRSLEWIGTRSYSIYLVHLPLIYLAKNSNFFVIGDGSSKFLQTICAVVFSILIGALTFKFVENRYRITPKIDNKKNKKEALILPLISLITLTFFFQMDQSVGKLHPRLPIPPKILPWMWDSDCRLMGDDQILITHPCEYGDSKAPVSILLIGDSQAASISRAVIAVAKTKSLKTYVYTHSRCPFILTSSANHSLKNVLNISQQCISHNVNVLRLIKKLDPKFIVIASISSEIYTFPSSIQKRELFRAQVTSSISQLKNSSRKIVFVGAGPEYSEVTTVIQKLTGAQGKHLSGFLEDAEFFKNISKDLFWYLDSVEIFCSQNICRNSINGNWLFSDGWHFNYEGANLLKPQLTKIFEK
jgi:peptidoglycan/LPS O-acetylase OafA/YrhL